jgi:hypothetical protein
MVVLLLETGQDKLYSKHFFQQCIWRILHMYHLLGISNFATCLLREEERSCWPCRWLSPIFPVFAYIAPRVPARCSVKLVYMLLDTSRTLLFRFYPRFYLTRGNLCASYHPSFYAPSVLTETYRTKRNLLKDALLAIYGVLIVEMNFKRTMEEYIVRRWLYEKWIIC